MGINEITSIIIEEAIYIHKVLGPGLMESVYEAALYHRLTKRGLQVKRQLILPVIFEDIKLDVFFKSDLIVEDKVIVELKSMEEVPKLHYKKVTTYLKLTKIKVALVINFNVDRLVDGIRRIVNNY